MTDRKRDPLPRGYQFGDAASAIAMRALDDSDGSRVIARTDMRGNRIVWQMGQSHWNVIEHEEH